MHIHISLFDIYIFFIILKMTFCPTHESKRLLVFKGRALAGMAGAGSSSQPAHAKQTPQEIMDGG